MCGIAGLYYADQRPIAQSVLDRMTDSLAHRGPDGRGTWQAAGVGLGHRRLAIRDLTQDGAQPMLSADGQVVVVFNGEIYNDQLLRGELAAHYGARFTSTADTAIIAPGWQAWGEQLFARLEGMFAIALWDVRQQQLILARDAVGIKPLYYSYDHAHGILRFGSELKALLADETQSRSLSAPDLATFMATGAPAPTRTLLQNVQQLAPGQMLVADRSGVRIKSYKAAPQAAHTISTMDDAVDRFVPLLREVVQSQLVSDVPVGVLQSGGVDSSLITLSLPQQAAVPLFTYCFSESSHDESHEAALVAKLAGRQLVRVEQAAHMQDAASIFDKMVWHSDGQLADSSAFPTYGLCQAVSAHTKVALCGDGGDEFFAGYPTYHATRLAHYLKPLLPASLWAQLGYLLRQQAGVSQKRVPMAEKLMRLLLGLAQSVPHVEWRRYLMPREAQTLWADAGLAQHDPLAEYAHEFTAVAGQSKAHWQQGLLADQRYYLPADMLVKSDRMSMAHGLELRVPLLDGRVRDFAASLSPQLLLSAKGQGKQVLRTALAQLGAGQMLSARRKTGFNVPLVSLLQGPLKKQAMHILLDETDIFEPWMKADAVRHLWHEHETGLVNHSYVIWSLMVFASWRKQCAI